MRFNTKKSAGLFLALLATVSSQVSEKTIKRTLKSKKGPSNQAAFEDIVNEGQYHRKNQITNRCTKVTFTTRHTKGAVSPGPFFVDGYGTVPVSCHNEQGANCELQLCGVDSIKIRAQTTNAWGFFLSGDDVGDLIDYENTNTAKGRGRTNASFPVYMDTNAFAIMLRYRRKSMPCSGKTTTLTFTTDTTNENAASNGRFFVGGYGVLPASCHNTLGAQCDIEICNDMVHTEDRITIHAQTEDPWLFTVTGDDLGELVEYRTAPGGTPTGNAFPTWMDTVQFSYMQRYSLLPSQCNGILNTLTFNTNGTRNSKSKGPFFIDGYGTIPSYCHESSWSACTIELCDAKDLTIRAQTTDAWVFTITGDIADLFENEVAFTEGARHLAPFPTAMDTNDFDIVQKYSIVHHRSDVDEYPSFEVTAQIGGNLGNAAERLGVYTFDKMYNGAAAYKKDNDFIVFYGGDGDGWQWVTDYYYWSGNGPKLSAVPDAQAFVRTRQFQIDGDFVDEYPSFEVTAKNGGHVGYDYRIGVYTFDIMYNGAAAYKNDNNFIVFYGGDRDGLGWQWLRGEYGYWHGTGPKLSDVPDAQAFLRTFEYYQIG